MNATKAEYVELNESDVSDMQRIVRLLTEYDEKTGRYLSYKDDPETHFARKAIGAASSGVRFVVRDLGGFVYSVIAYYEGSGSRIATAWVHEDGIQQERESGMQIPESIRCLTDFVRSASAVNLDFVPVSVLDLMMEMDG
ncbi:MAG TPA: hypothetical protein PKN93_18775 [Leptospiraceae bacterium]|nr:hypothetical protein [Leptospiraceae bacterium]